MFRYLLAMGIRMVCIILVVTVPDLWKIIPGIGAVALPYFAVVVANNVRRAPGGRVERPGAIVRVPPSGRDAA